MHQLLKRFFEDQATRESFREFQIAVLKDMAVDYVFEKKDTTGIHEAKKVVDKSFDRLEEMYGKIQVTEPDSPR